MPSSRQPVHTDIAEEALSLIGTRFHHQGRTEAGLDCVGLLSLSAHRSGYDVSRVPNTYARTPDGQEFVQYLELLCQPITSPTSGDAILFWVRDEGIPRHIGVYIEDGWMVHAFSKIGMNGREEGRVDRCRIDQRWQKRIMGYYRVNGNTSPSRGR